MRAAHSISPSPRHAMGGKVLLDNSTPPPLFSVTAADGAWLQVSALGGPGGGPGAGPGGGPGAAPGIIFAHANGLAALSYGPWLAELAKTVRVFAYDARGHGQARWPEGSLETVFHVERFADDLALVAERVAEMIRGAPLAFVGHSLGAAASLQLAIRQERPRFAEHILFEPPIFPPPDSPTYEQAITQQQELVARSARRRAAWPDQQSFLQLLEGRGVFAGFRRDLLEAHVRATLRPEGAGGFTLRCPPAIESAIFRAHRAANTWAMLGRVRERVHLVSGDPTLPQSDWVSGAMAAIAGRIPDSTLTVLEGTGHMMIFEAPDRAAQCALAPLRRFFRRHA